jgi:hypothetical protein
LIFVNDPDQPPGLTADIEGRREAGLYCDQQMNLGEANMKTILAAGAATLTLSAVSYGQAMLPIPALDSIAPAIVMPVVPVGQPAYLPGPDLGEPVEPMYVPAPSLREIPAIRRLPSVLPDTPQRLPAPRELPMIHRLPGAPLPVGPALFAAQDPKPEKPTALAQLIKLILGQPNPTVLVDEQPPVEKKR